MLVSQLLEDPRLVLTDLPLQHMACIGGRYKVVEGLLKLGANQNIKDRWGQTPMAIAITAKQQMVITVLASSKAKLDMASPELALCTAAGAGDAQQVKRLIDFGVAPNIGDYDKRTALHVSSAEGHEKIVEFLLVSQADPNCKDRWGGTPLQDALVITCDCLMDDVIGKVPQLHFCLAIQVLLQPTCDISFVGMTV